MKKIKQLEEIDIFGYPFAPDINDIWDENVKSTIIRLVANINALVKTLNLLSEAIKK